MDEADLPVWMESASGEIEKFSFERFMLDQEREKWQDMFVSLEE